MAITTFWPMGDEMPIDWPTRPSMPISSETSAPAPAIWASR